MTSFGCPPRSNRSGEGLEVDGQGRLNGSTADDDVLALHDPLDDAERVVDRPLHFVAVEVARAAEDDGGCGANLGLLDEDQLVVADTRLANFQGVAFKITRNVTIEI